MAKKDEKAEDAGVSEEDTEETEEEQPEEQAEETEASESEGQEGEEAQDEEAAAAKKEKKKKKVVRRRKTKRERENPLTTAIRLAVESGKVEFGSKSGLSASASGKAKLFVMAGNTPLETKSKIDASAKASKVPVIEFEGSTMDLGSVCGKPFPVAVLSVFEEGSSNILELAKKK